MIDAPQPAEIGTIRRVHVRGFGFVATDAGREYFFHASSCPNFDALRQGDRVAFEIDPTGHAARPVAIRVRPT